jgi:type II secretory pathway pseudopilin PulG
MKRSSIADSPAFSLVEVTLALGIVSFALVAVLGLLPVGLKSVKNANEQAGAANVLNAIAGSLRTATTTDGINYSNSFAGKTITYVVGPGAGLTKNWDNLKLDGGEVIDPAEVKRLSAVLEIIEQPSNAATPGRAVVTVAWSAQANPSWDGQKWTKADGSITSGIQFLPKP